MNNNIFEGMSLDQINEFKQRMQLLVPLVELMKIPNHANSLLLLEKEQGLAIMGYSKKQIKEWCEPKKHNEKEAEKMLMRAMKENQREIRQYKRARRQDKTIDSRLAKGQM